MMNNNNKMPYPTINVKLIKELKPFCYQPNSHSNVCMYLWLSCFPCILGTKTEAISLQAPCSNRAPLNDLSSPCLSFMLVPDKVRGSFASTTFSGLELSFSCKKFPATLAKISKACIWLLSGFFLIVPLP